MSNASLKPTTIDLSPHLDLTAAGPLAERLLAARGEPVVLLASGVEKLGAQCLQVLLSAVGTWKADMTPLDIAKPSGGFHEGLATLGLTFEGLLAQEIVR